MFEEYFEQYGMYDTEKASRKRVKSGEKALMALVGGQPARRGRAFKALRIAAVCAAAAACLTVTAGAAGGWSFLRNIFAENTEAMEKYAMTDNFEVIAETYENYDFEVVGLAHDDYIFYIAIDITAKNGAKISDYARSDGFSMDWKFDTDGHGLGVASKWENASEERATFVVRADTRPRLEGTGSFILRNLASKYGKEEYLEIRISYEDTEKKEIALERDVPVPVIELREGKIGTQPRFDETWYIERVVISGISVTFEGKAPRHSDIPVCSDDDRIYLLMNDGTRENLRSSGTGGEIIDGSVCGTTTFAVKHPVDISEIKALVIGEEVIDVN